MANDKIRCSIEFDDEWIQKDCHWDYKRFFNLTFEVLDSSLTNLKFYCKLGKASEMPIVPSKKNNTYTYVLSLSDLLDTILSQPDTYLDTNYLTITTGVKKDTKVLSSTSYDYHLILPPSSENLTVTLTRKSADNIICSWAKPTDIENNPSVAGYSIELFCKKKGTDTFVQYKNLGWAVYPADYEDETLRGQFITDNEGRHKLTEVTDNSDPDISVSDIPGECSFKGIGSSYELRTGGPEEVSFYFRPRDFDIQKDDFFMIKVCPYVVYGSYLEGSNFEQGTLLTSISEDNNSNEMKFTLGVVRVKTDKGWVEGQVWVMTANGWKEADSIYTKTADGWKEAIS